MAEARAAQKLGLTITQWDDLTDHDRAWALAPDLVPTGGDICGVCDGPKAICQDPDAEMAWVIEASRCHKTRAVMQYMESRKDDKYAAALHLTARIDPTRRYSARTR